MKKTLDEPITEEAHRIVDEIWKDVDDARHWGDGHQSAYERHVGTINALLRAKAPKPGAAEDALDRSRKPGLWSRTPPKPEEDAWYWVWIPEHRHACPVHSWANMKNVLWGPRIPEPEPPEET